MVERPLRMRKVSGSIPDSSKHEFAILHKKGEKKRGILPQQPDYAGISYVLVGMNCANGHKKRTEPNEK